MNNKKSINELILVPLRDIFGEPEWNEPVNRKKAHLDTWHRVLANYADNELKQGLDAFLAKNKYDKFPLPAKIKECCPKRDFNSFNLPVSEIEIELGRKSKAMADAKYLNDQWHDKVPMRDMGEMAKQYCSNEIVERFKNYPLELTMYAILNGKETNLVQDMREVG